VLEISSKRGEIRGNAEKLSRNVAASSTSEICFKSRWAKNNFFAATQNHHHQTVRCISVEEKNLFLKHKIILKTYFRIAYIS